MFYFHFHGFSFFHAMASMGKMEIIKVKWILWWSLFIFRYFTVYNVRDFSFGKLDIVMVINISVLKSEDQY